MTIRIAEIARLLVLVGLLSAPCWAGSSVRSGFPSQLNAIGLSSGPGSTRVVVHLDGTPQLETREGAVPTQWQLELRNTTVAPSFQRRLMTSDGPPVRFVRVAEDGFGNTRVVFDLEKDADGKPQVTLYQRSVVVEWRTVTPAPFEATPPVTLAAKGTHGPSSDDTGALGEAFRKPPIRYQIPSSSGAVSPPRLLTSVDADRSLPAGPDCCAPQPAAGAELLHAASPLPDRPIALPMERFDLPHPSMAHSPPVTTALAPWKLSLPTVGPLQPAGQEVLRAAAPRMLADAPATVDPTTLQRFNSSSLAPTQPAATAPAATDLNIAAPALDGSPPKFEEVLMAAAPSSAPLIAPAPIAQPAKPSRPRRLRKPLANLLVGQRVKIEVKKFKGQKLVADEIELIEEEGGFEVEGPLTDLDLESGTFSVGPARVLMYEKTEVEGSDRKPREISELRNQVRVKVKAKSLKNGFIKARTVRIYEKAADRDFEIAAPIDLISVRDSEIELLSMTVKVDGKTEYKNFGFVEGDYSDDGVGRRIRRDDDAQHPDPIRIGNVYLGGRVSMGFECSRNLDLDPDEPDSDDWMRPSARLEVSAPLGEYSEAYARIDFRNANHFGNNPAEQGATEFQLREGFIYWGNFLHRSLGLQVGRQRFRDKREFLFDERLDAVRLHYTKKKLKVEVAVAKGVFGQSTSTDQQLYLMAYSQYRLPRKRYISGYFMKRNDTTPRDEDPIWFGMSSRGRITRRLSYWGELVRVTGRRGNLLLRGHAFDLGGSYRFPQLPLNQTLSLGYAYGSGDKDFSDGIDGNFTQTNLQDNSYRYNGLKRYRYYGVLLEPELRNVKIQTLDYGIRPSESWSLNFAYHAYRQVVAAKKIGDTQLDMNPHGRDPRLGTEIDTILGIRKIRNIDITLLMGVFFPGSAFVGAPPRAFFFRPAITYYF